MAARFVARMITAKYIQIGIWNIRISVILRIFILIEVVGNIITTIMGTIVMVKTKFCAKWLGLITIIFPRIAVVYPVIA